MLLIRQIDTVSWVHNLSGKMVFPWRILQRPNGSACQSALILWAGVDRPNITLPKERPRIESRKIQLLFRFHFGRFVYKRNNILELRKWQNERKIIAKSGNFCWRSCGHRLLSFLFFWKRSECQIEKFLKNSSKYYAESKIQSSHTNSENLKNVKNYSIKLFNMELAYCI